jgi:peptidoglycan/LPS O-acetylase OafA/YrhL
LAVAVARESLSRAEAQEKVPQASARSVKHIPSLDGLRAISFALVFLGHVGLDRYVPGGFGVTVFFFLSGFLITTLMRVEFQAHTAINLSHFWLRRALRILPPFYLVLAAATLSTLLANTGLSEPVSWSAVAARALHVTNYWIISHGYDGEPSGTGVYWSLAVEEHFYLLFPFLYIFMQRRALAPRTQALLLWAICGAVLLWRCVLVLHYHVEVNRTYLGTDTRLDSILFGCALAVWNNPVLDRQSQKHDQRWKFLYVPAAAAVLAFCLVYRGDAFRETWRYSLQGVALTFVFIAAIRFHHWAIFRFLNLRFVAYAGVLSYSLYLVHYPVIFALQRWGGALGALPAAILAFAISLGLAQLMYVGIERPCARLRKRLTD